MVSSIQLKLVRAAKGGDLEGLQTALERGGQVDGGGGSGRQALHEASEAGHLEVVKLLLNHKAQVNSRSKRHGDEGGTALHLATEAGNVNIMEELLKAGADPEARDEKGRTAALWAAYGGQQEALQVLEGQNNELLFAYDYDHSTALHLAAAHGDLKVVKWLVNHGLDCGARDHRNKTPKDIAKERKWQDVHLFLKQHQSPSKRSRPISPWRGSMGYLSTRSKTSHTSEDEVSSKEAASSLQDSATASPKTATETSTPEPTSLPLLRVEEHGRHTDVGYASLNLSDLGVQRLEEEPRGALAAEQHRGRRDDPEREADRDMIISLRSQLETLQGEVARLRDRDKTTQEELRRRDEEGEALKLAEAEMKAKVSQLTRRLEERQREETERSRAEVLPPGSPVTQVKIKELQRQNEYNQKIIEDMNDEIDDLYKQVKVLEVTAATTQARLKGKESLLQELEEEAKQTEEKLKEEAARLSKRLEDERRKVTEAQQDSHSLQQLQGEEAALRRTIGSLQEQLRLQETDYRQQGAALRKQLLEEEASHRQAVDALRKQLKAEEDSNRTVIASLRQQLQDSTEVQEQDSHLRQYIASMRQQLQEEETANRKNVAALRQQLQEQEVNKRETVASLRQQLQDQEDSSKRSIASLKQQLQEEEDINRQTITSLRQQLQDATSQQEQGTYNRQQITALRQQLLEEGAAHKKTIASLRQQLQEQEDSHVQAVTTLKQQLQEATNKLQQDALHRQQISSLKQQLQEQEETNKQTVNVLKQQMQREEQNSRQTMAELRQELSRMSLRHTEVEQKSITLQRDHEELLREAEHQQERSRKTTEELNASVAHLTARLREQEEALTCCKEKLQDKDKLLEEKQEEARLKETTLKEEVERISRRLEEERQKVGAAQAREFETSRKLHEHVGDLERIIDSLNDEVSEKTSKIGEYEQMVASYQVQLRHKERQLEQREAAGQQSVATLQQKVDALAQMLEEEQQKTAQGQEQLQEAEEKHRQEVEALKQQMQEVVEEAEEEKQGNLSLQKQQQKRIQELLVQDQHNKSIMNERNNKIKEFEQTFSSYEVQLQNYRKQIEQHEANKQQTIAALSSEVVRLSQKMEEEKRKAAAAQNRTTHLIEQDRVNKLNITDLSNKLRDHERTIAAFQREKEQIQEEVAKWNRSSESQQLVSSQQELLKETQAKLEAERQERAREQEATQQRMAALEDAVARSSRQASSHVSRSRSRSRPETPSRVTLMPTGIPNLGNTCYINSVVQCLFSITILRDYFTSDAYRRDLYRGSELQGQVAAAVCGVFKGLEEGHGERDVRTRIKHLKEVAGVCSEEFRGSQQKNAHDFLSSLLNWLHEDLTRPSGSSVVTKNFAGSIREVVRCDRSGEEVKRSSRTFTTLSIPVPRGKAFNLQDLLESHFRPHNEEWECPHCRRTHVCRQHTRLIQLPPLLIIHLSRVGNPRDGHSKKARVSFPLESLTLQEYMDHRDRSPTYELFGLVSHQGTMSAGHYTAFCRSPPDSTWRQYDDDQVSEVPLRRVQAEADVHVLFYSLLKT
ncbi:ankycorbin-like isoform X1 [Portunus trituberculatus]|uniref:ankycorbin-like isoform X1 n=1 Tax=Portunus trituberculatus TaxID=210409 RepID=UPI001E1CD13F|nr:ankycorbin-like isoform X1 [Portunus trituberculatus]XP_045120611.1 ankycorbin-like isoform X1 [Portunus trituberculatus]XP_045120612.1 ankycorbin-like isoform X1 [Portunus trituberculatus]XP_045120613.1 ankycorbin-like isoform X1 [Portunus trituberculatus]